MKSLYAYSFLAGVFVGGYTNFFSKLVISGLVLYIVNPQNFSLEKFSPLYTLIYQKTYPYISKVYDIRLIEDITDQPVEAPIKETTNKETPKKEIKLILPTLKK